MGPRWKGRGSEAKALSQPMSQLVSELRDSLMQSQAQAMLCGSVVLLSLDSQQADFLNRACFGIPVGKHRFELGPEEAFYLSHALRCLKIVDQHERSVSKSDLWRLMKSERDNFPEFYKAYAHLRAKNWVVKSGVRYGADFVAYRHHPGLVHAEFAVLVSSRGRGLRWDSRLQVWSDVHCAVRLSGGVVKTLLVLDVTENGSGDDSAACLDGFRVSERAITRWLPERCREERSNSNLNSNSNSTARSETRKTAREIPPRASESNSNSNWNSNSNSNSTERSETQKTAREIPRRASESRVPRCVKYFLLYVFLYFVYLLIM